MTNYRNFVFTWNNYTDDHLAHIANVVVPQCEYLIYGKEVGESGTPHLQGYAELKKRTRCGTVNGTLLLGLAHTEMRKGKQAQAIAYCMKDGDYTEFGHAKGRGERTDLDRTREMAQDEGMRAVTRVCNLQQIRVAKEFLTHNEKGRDWLTDVTWIYGEGGRGKTSLARKIAAEEEHGDIYVKTGGSGKWWEGYDAHDCIIIDDFQSMWWNLKYMLGILGDFEFRVEQKGGSRQMLASRIFVTSISHPKDAYYEAEDPKAKQMLRRIKTIIHMPANYVSVFYIVKYDEIADEYMVVARDPPPVPAILPVPLEVAFDIPLPAVVMDEKNDIRLLL